MIERYPCLQDVVEDIQTAVALLKNSIICCGTIFTAGNGGSAADAEHIVGELMKGFRLKRRLTPAQVSEFGRLYPDEAAEITSNLQQAIPAVSLVTSVALSTAYANDVNSDYTFAQQLYGLGKKGDAFIAISTSGNSVNVINAAKTAKVKGVSVIGLTGASGGKLAEYCDVVIKVPAVDVAEIQELHLPVYHYICGLLEQDLFTNADTDLLISKKDRQLSVTKDKFFPENIELIVFDFDGVFTDNKVYTSQDGTEFVQCDRRDSLGINYLQDCGFKMFVLSTETNPVVSVRAKKMGLDVVGSCGDKAYYLRDYFKEHKLNPANVLYVGNDLNDKASMKYVGFSAAPNDAHPEIKEIASLVLSANGGDGAVREFCEYILKHRSKN